MAIHRESPKCYKCGGVIDGIYEDIPNFYGDTFLKWDWDGHTCPDDVIEAEKAALKAEYEDYLLRCGSCIHFASFMAEAGFCKLAECNCVCKNPKAMIDIWTDKCEKWEINPKIEPLN